MIFNFWKRLVYSADDAQQRAEALQKAARELADFNHDSSGSSDMYWDMLVDRLKVALRQYERTR